MKRYTFHPSFALQTLRAKLGRDVFAPLARAPKSATIYNAEATSENGRPLCGGGCRWVENASHGLRIIGAAHEIHPGYRHNSPVGWYVESFCDKTTVAHVIALPGRNGTPIFCPATSDPWNPDSFLINFSAAYSGERETRSYYQCSGPSIDGASGQALRDCANAAQRLAERFAEDCREDDARRSAEEDIKEAQESIRGARAAHSALAPAAKYLSGPPLAAVKSELARFRADVRQARKIIAKRRDNYWSAVECY